MAGCKTIDVLRWLDRVMQLPGKSPMKIAMFLIQRGAKVKRVQFLAVTKRDLEQIEMSRVAAFDALNAMAQAELVSLDRSQGRAPVVTLIGLEFE